MNISQKGVVTTIRFDNVTSGWEQWFLLTSDRHHDSAWCNRDLERIHLVEAQERRALIVDAGDLFDAMQGRYDPRRNYPDLRSEYKCANYYDALLDDFAEFYGPFAPLFALIGKGNHESSVVKCASTDLTQRFVQILRQKGSQVQAGDFGGWIRCMLYGPAGHGIQTVKIKYFHGAGSEAPVTKGTIQTNRQAVYQPDADVVLNGHNHWNYILPLKRERLNNKGDVVFDLQYHVRTPGYKEDYRDGGCGWEVERGGNPKPIGAVWMRMHYQYEKVDLQFTAAVE